MSAIVPLNSFGDDGGIGGLIATNCSHNLIRSPDLLLEDTPFNDSSSRTLNIPPSGDGCVSLIGVGGGEPYERGGKSRDWGKW